MTFLLVYIIDLRFSVIGWATKSCPAKISLDENNADKSLSGNNLKKISFPRKFVGTAAPPPPALKILKEAPLTNAMRSSTMRTHKSA